MESYEKHVIWHAENIEERRKKKCLAWVSENVLVMQQES